MTANEATQLVARLKAAYPRQTIGEDTVAVWVRLLADLDYQDASDAANAHIASSTFFPAIAEIRGLVAERALGLPGWVDAWQQVSDAAEAGAGWTTLAPAVREAAKAIGGQWAIRTTEQPVALRAQFRDAYLELRAAAITGITTPAELRGRTEQALPSSKEYPPWLAKALTSGEGSTTA